jgi:hypothetical protein
MEGTDTEEIYRHADIHNIYVFSYKVYIRMLQYKCSELKV